MNLFKTLQPKSKHRNSPTCLLLDVSGSMSQLVKTPDETTSTRLDLLKKAVNETPECTGLKAFKFSDTCQSIEVIDSLITEGGTDLAGAFNEIKTHGFFNAILVTDGEPDSHSQALSAASGLRLGIIYIGNPPVPHFLQKLAAATDGTFQLSDLSNLQLSSSLAGAIEDMRGQNEEKDSIKL